MLERPELIVRCTYELKQSIEEDNYRPGNNKFYIIYIIYI